MFTASLGLGANIQTQSKELRKTKGLNIFKGNEAQVQIITGIKGKQNGQNAQWWTKPQQSWPNPDSNHCQRCFNKVRSLNTYVNVIFKFCFFQGTLQIIVCVGFDVVKPHTVIAQFGWAASSRKSLGGSELLPFKNDGGHCVLGDLQCCRHFLVPLPKFVPRHSLGSELYGQVLRIQTLCYETQNWAQVHPVSIGHPWDVSTTWSTPVINSIDWTWFGKAHTCLYKVPQLTVHGRALRSKELSVQLRDRIVSRHRLGKGTKTFLLHWRSPRTQWPPSFLNGRSLEPPRLFLELAARPTEQLGKKGLGQGGAQEPDGHKVPLWRWENLAEGQSFLQHSTNQAFMVEWPDG